MSTCSLQARWVFPVEGPPIADGVLTIGGDRVVSVEPPAGRSVAVELGDVALLPGLVNAHTHLDLGALRGKLPPPGVFTEWLRGVVGYRRASTPANWGAAIRDGIEESISCGTTLVGDISTGGLSHDLLSVSPLRAAVFHEMIGLTAERARQTATEARTWLATRRSTPNTRLGLSPHAPYSVRSSLFGEAARAAGLWQAPLAVHLAETRAELELLQAHDGPFRRFLEDIGAWDEEGLASNLAWIMEQLAGGHVLYIHANYLPPKWWGRLEGKTVVYCPRTHAFFHHEPHPYREMLAAEVNVALGTDSLASNPDLSVLEEMRFLWRRDRDALSGETLLRMGTLNGAVALRWDGETGSLKPGKSADWITVPLPDEEAVNPHRLLFESATAVRDVMIRGQWVLRDHKRVMPTETPA